MAEGYPVIPETITVHLGPPDSQAENIQVPFVEYIKNVASHEIYPTWPENAIRANIYAQISYALNRVYTEHYRTQGYDFDITNSTAYDQSYVNDGEIFDNIARIVDDIFNSYVVKQGSIAPYFTQYCNGTTSTCPGLSQWGTVSLANSGYIPYRILTHYYGDDINIVTDAPVAAVSESYPGYPLELGTGGNEVETLEIELNRIRQNYPAIPPIENPDGTFGVDTENAVRAFQGIFGMEQDGIVGKSTWYRIKQVFNGVKRLSELSSEEITYDEVSPLYPQELEPGDTGDIVSFIQYYLAVLGYFNDRLPVINITGVYDSATRNAVLTFQQLYGLPQTGIVNAPTWVDIRKAYDDLISGLPRGYFGIRAELYPGYLLSRGMANEDVRDLQTYLNTIAAQNQAIPAVDITGYYGEETTNAVAAFQQSVGLEANGIAGPVTWNEIAREYNRIVTGEAEDIFSPFSNPVG